jgi:hypothetical protein
MTDTLRKLTVIYDDKKRDWALTQDKTNRVFKRFATKAELTKGGVLAGVLGKAGGSVKIQKRDGQYQEERTYPRSKDPRGSKG